MSAFCVVSARCNGCPSIKLSEKSINSALNALKARTRNERRDCRDIFRFDKNKICPLVTYKELYCIINDFLMCISKSVYSNILNRAREERYLFTFKGFYEKIRTLGYGEKIKIKGLYDNNEGAIYMSMDERIYGDSRIGHTKLLASFKRTVFHELAHWLHFFRINEVIVNDINNYFSDRINKYYHPCVIDLGFASPYRLTYCNLPGYKDHFIPDILYRCNIYNDYAGLHDDFAAKEAFYGREMVACHIEGLAFPDCLFEEYCQDIHWREAFLKSLIIFN